MADTWNTNDTSQTVDITDVPGNDGKASSSAATSVLKRILSQIKTLSSRLRNIELPTALRRKVLKQYLTAAAVAIGTLVLMLIYRQISCLAGIVLSAMLVGSTMTIKLDYDNGNIQENALICVSVSTLHLRKSTRVVFRTQDEEPTYMEFFVPGRKNYNQNIVPNYVYLVYFNKSAPSQLLAIEQL